MVERHEHMFAERPDGMTASDTSGQRGNVGSLSIRMEALGSWI
jgi:hypothetical protein